MRRPQVPPPEPPPVKQRHSSLEHHRSLEREQPIPQPLDKKGERERNGNRNFENVTRKMSHELLSRSSALNDRYFETDKSRSKSLDDLLAGGGGGDSATDAQLTPSEHDEQDPLPELGLSESRLNDRYHSAERLAPLVPREQTPRYQKSQYAGRRTAGSHSRYMERSDYATRSSAMSDTSEAPSLASHVRRVRVPSQASDVDQFLDELFSPVLDGSLDELSDARSLSASIRGERENFTEAPIAIDDDLNDLSSAQCVWRSIKGGVSGGGSDKESDAKAKNVTTSTLDREVEDINNPMEVSLDEYITGEFDSLRKDRCQMDNFSFLFLAFSISDRLISTDFRQRFAETFDRKIRIGRCDQRRRHHASTKHIQWLRRIAANGRSDSRKFFARFECASRRRSDALSAAHATGLLAIGDGAKLANSATIVGPESGTENSPESTGDGNKSHTVAIFVFQFVAAQNQFQRSRHIAPVHRQRTHSQGIIGQQQFARATTTSATDAATT